MNKPNSRDNTIAVFVIFRRIDNHTPESEIDGRILSDVLQFVYVSEITQTNFISTSENSMRNTGKHTEHQK